MEVSNYRPSYFYAGASSNLYIVPTSLYIRLKDVDLSIEEKFAAIQLLSLNGPCSENDIGALLQLINELLSNKEFEKVFQACQLFPDDFNDESSKPIIDSLIYNQEFEIAIKLSLTKFTCFRKFTIRSVVVKIRNMDELARLIVENYNDPTKPDDNKFINHLMSWIVPRLVKFGPEPLISFLSLVDPLFEQGKREELLDLIDDIVNPIETRRYSLGSQIRDLWYLNTVQ